jgi:hypothetical protein
MRTGRNCDIFCQWVPLVEQELLSLPEHLSSFPVFSGVRFTPSLVLCACPFEPFLWPLCCLFFFDIRILITPLVSSNSSFLTMPCFIDCCLKLAGSLSDILVGGHGV